jgi:hypothetical protein
MTILSCWWSLPGTEPRGLAQAKQKRAEALWDIRAARRRLTFEIVLSDLCCAWVNLQAGLVHGVETGAREQHVILRGAVGRGSDVGGIARLAYDGSNAGVDEGRQRVSTRDNSADANG